MHELAICQGLLSQVRRVAEQKGATSVHSIRLRIGPLSGVEAPLLRQAFSIARGDTIAQGAGLEIEFAPVTVQCRICGAESAAAPNRLLCGQCNAWQVRVTGGDELLLMSVELSGMPATAGTAPISNREEHPTHV